MGWGPPFSAKGATAGTENAWQTVQTTDLGGGGPGSLGVLSLSSGSLSSDFCRTLPRGVGSASSVQTGGLFLGP